MPDTPERDTASSPLDAEEPPFHHAVRLGDIAEMERLLGGVKINAKIDLPDANLYEVTALMVAAQSVEGATVDTLSWLLDHGADLHARSANGGTAAWHCAGGGGRKQFRPWRQMPDHVERLRFLLDAGLPSDDRTVNGQSLLTQACKTGDPARVRLLLERGVSPNPSEQISSEGFSVFSPTEETSTETSAPAPGHFDPFQIPLYCATVSGSAECVRLLLDAGANLHVLARDGSPTLAVAGSPEVVRVLIGAGADPNAQDVLDRVLHDLNYHSDPEDLTIAQALLDAGAIPDSAALKEWTPPHKAEFHEDTEELASLFKQRASCLGISSGTPLHGICWREEYSDPEPNIACERIIRMLVAAGVPLDVRDEQGNTALHEAVAGGGSNPTAVRILLEVGAQPDLINDVGNTPLHLAAARGSLSGVTALLAAGVDPLRQDRHGDTSIVIAHQNLRLWAGLSEAILRRWKEVDPESESASECESEMKQFQEAEDCLNALIAAATRS